MSVDLTSASAAFQAVFALDLITATITLVFLGLATRPTFKRIAERRFSTTDGEKGSPLKTTLGTYLFLYPALGFFFLAYVFRFVVDLLQTEANVIYYDGLQLQGRPSSTTTLNRDSVAGLSFAQALVEILFTTLINGGIWIYSNHVTTNSTGNPGPGMVSKLWNSFIMLAILGTGLAAWARGLVALNGFPITWSAAVHDNTANRALYAAYRAVVIVASTSVSVEVLLNYIYVIQHSFARVS